MIRALRDVRSWGKVADAYRRGLTILPYPPQELWIEPTNRCNLRCGKCPHAVGLQRPKGTMGMETHREVIDQIAGRTPLVSMHLGGESLLVKDLHQRIRYAKERRVFVVLHSNGLLLDEETSRRLIGSGLDILSVSVDGEDESSYQDAMGGGSFELLEGNIRRFLQVRRGRKPFLVLRVTRPSPQQFTRLADTPLIRWGADYLHVVDQHVWSGKDASRRRQLGLGREGLLSPCARIWYGMSILWNAAVAPCCMDMEGEHPVGDLRSSTIDEVWNGEEMVRLRRRHAERSFEEIALCNDCDELRLDGPHGALKEARRRAKQWLREKVPGLFRPYGKTLDDREA